MGHAALAGFILLGIYKLLDKRYLKKDDFHAVIDWYMSFAVVIASSVAIAIFNIAVTSFGLPAILVFLSYSLYLFVPFLILKLMLDYKPKKAFAYAVWVPFIAVIAEIPFILLFGAESA